MQLIKRAALVFITGIWLCVLAPTSVLAYGQGTYYAQPYYQSYYQAYYQAYYQSYYQSYYQAYYQAYYQSYYQTGYYAQASYYAEAAYGLTFTQPVTVLGTTSVTGAVSKGGGSFVIDDPLDPLNKLLYHSFVESPDVKNWYDGIATLDQNGEAVVRLPAYFEALNKDFRYQLKPIDRAMPNLYIKQEEKNNQFIIAGGVAGGIVSWQITGIRHDPYIVANPINVEVQKGGDSLVAKGQFVYPEGYDRHNYALIAAALLTCLAFLWHLGAFTRIRPRR